MSAPQNPAVSYPAEWDQLELKDVRVSVLETVREIANAEVGGLRLDALAVYLLDDLGAADEPALVPWDCYLFENERALFRRLVKSLDAASSPSGQADLPMHVRQLHEAARELLGLMERRGSHQFR